MSYCTFLPASVVRSFSGSARPGRLAANAAFAGLVLHFLLLAGPAGAQQLTNTGQPLYVGAGATLYVGGSYAQSGAATLTTAGTAQLTGGLTAAAGTTLDLSTGRLEVGGHLQSAGTTTSSATGTLRLNGAAPQTLDTGGGTVGQLVLDKPAAAPRVDLPTDLTVLGGVTLTGGLLRTAAGSTLILSDGATLTGEASGNYVQGNLRATRAAVSGPAPVAFPNSITLNPNGNNLGRVTVTRTAGLQTAGLSYGQNGLGTNKGIDRLWRVVPATAPASPVDVTLAWLADDDNGFTLAQNARLWQAAAPAGPWQPQGAAAAAGTRAFAASTPSLGYLTVSNVSQPLPVTLTAFTAQAEGSGALLRWSTASELNSAYFEVEGSPDGLVFRAVGRVAAGGTRTQAQEYTLRDPDLARYAAPVVYYRLRQQDLDGTFSYSPVRLVAVPAGPWSAALWPNPAAPDQAVTLQLRTAEATPLTLQLRDATGRLLRERTAAPGPALGLPEFDGLPAGLYLLHVAQAGQHATLRVVRQ